MTLRRLGDVSLTIASAHFRKKADVSSESPDTLLGASGALVAGADANSRHVFCDALRPSGDKGECIVDWCAQSCLSIDNAGSATRRPGGSRARQHWRHRASRCVETPRSKWKPTRGPDSDHYWITFDAFVGTSLDVIAPSERARALNAWSKARWKELEN
ncbi:hypothetical protein ERJ75_001382000 [Trypanosoma vivax]|nr:hypothetical protein ERJ75_001382000 [Trypanosoma vivax]